MTDNTPPRREDKAPTEPTNAETEFLNCHVYNFVDSESDRTRQRLDPALPPPPTDKDKQG